MHNLHTMILSLFWNELNGIVFQFEQVTQVGRLEADTQVADGHRVAADGRRVAMDGRRQDGKFKPYNQTNAFVHTN